MGMTTVGFNKEPHQVHTITTAKWNGNCIVSCLICNVGRRHLQFEMEMTRKVKLNEESLQMHTISTANTNDNYVIE